MEEIMVPAFLIACILVILGIADWIWRAARRHTYTHHLPKRLRDTFPR